MSESGSDFPNSALLSWYGRVKRDLPWRGTTDPYAIWISEVILQQTRVDQGMPYYHRFMDAFPTVQALASASEHHVLKLWEGLGYYSRARNLHAAAKQVVSEHGGVFPRNHEGLLALRGVGPYTAAAIGSIAFGLPVACVDGNVIRVISRYHGISDPVDSPAVVREIGARAQEALDRSRPGDHNQAMMELGATVCVPRAPLCGECPLREGCVARAEGLWEHIPFKARRTKVRDRYFHYLAITDGRQTLVERRPAGDIWQGLYQFPVVESDGPLAPDEALQRSGLAQGAVIVRSFGPLRHVLSHQRIHASLSVCRMELLPDFDAEPMNLGALHRLAFPRLLHHFLSKELFADSENV